MKKIFIIALIYLISFRVEAQRGYSSASVSMSRTNVVYRPDQVVVEEFINYHTHKIPLPKKNEKVALSLTSDSYTQKTKVLQIGIATQELLDYSETPPVNVALVIDQSGSMSGGNRLEKVKKATKQFLKGLRPDDYISLVVYSSHAEVIIPATKVKDISYLEKSIQSLQPYGSTNINAGLMLGYKEVQKNFNKKMNNKVVLLTDGLVNTGETDFEKIVANSLVYNEKGIDVATIGVGGDVNFNLLKQIAKAGRGQNHFVGDTEEDIKKVFVDELESLLSPIGKFATLEVTFPKELKIKNIYGYKVQYKSNSFTIHLDNLNSGLTQVVLCEFENIKPRKKYAVTAKLNYVPFGKFSTVGVTEKCTLVQNKSDKFSNKEVKKNYYIGEMAASLDKMAKLVEEEKYQKGYDEVDATLKNINQVFPFLKDADIKRVQDILKKQHIQLGKYLKSLKAEK